MWLPLIGWLAVLSVDLAVGSQAGISWQQPAGAAGAAMFVAAAVHRPIISTLAACVKSRCLPLNQCVTYRSTSGRASTRLSASNTFPPAQAKCDRRRARRAAAAADLPPEGAGRPPQQLDLSPIALGLPEHATFAAQRARSGRRARELFLLAQRGSRARRHGQGKPAADRSSAPSLWQPLQELGTLRAAQLPRPGQRRRACNALQWRVASARMASSGLAVLPAAAAAAPAAALTLTPRALPSCLLCAVPDAGQDWRGHVSVGTPPMRALLYAQAQHCRWQHQWHSGAHAGQHLSIVGHLPAPCRYGVVFKAKDKLSQRVLALKQIRYDSLAGQLAAAGCAGRQDSATQFAHQLMFRGSQL